MNFISKYFHDKRERERLFNEAVAFQKEELAKKEAAEAAAAEQEAKRIIDERIRMESAVPWLEVIGEPYDLENPSKLPISERYRWNPAFIKKLRDEDYVGESDAQIIRDWEHKTALDKLNRLNEQEKKKRQLSQEPWIEIIGQTYDPETKQVSMEFDWNPAMIRMLRQNGYTGRDDQEIIDKYFKRLSDDISMELHGAKYD